MHRTAALTLTVGLLLAGCGSGGTASPAPASAATSTAGGAPSTTADPSSSATPGSVPPALDSWAAAFCTAAAPLTSLGALAAPDTSSPQSTKTSLAAFYHQGADVFTRAAAALAPVGPPPGGSDPQLTQGVVDALHASATKFGALASAADAANPADAAAIGALVSGYSAAVAALRASFASLNKGRSPQVGAAIAAAPECTPMAG